ncbi:MAG: hypothetical protein MK158_04505 [Dehalococcoidia bacterium]|jgi:hypothetical protein|nr:hypothetical protein [Dehalococcoidia bacterium]|tara:strand:- start:1717 stop:1878 length:162 start_codon:yes stop_codon:yes gene_type:complete
MFQLLGLATLPLRLAIKLMKLPFTIMSCITKLGCLLVVIGIPVGIVVLIIYLT